MVGRRSTARHSTHCIASIAKAPSPRRPSLSCPQRAGPSGQAASVPGEKKQQKKGNAMMQCRDKNASAFVPEGKSHRPPSSAPRPSRPPPRSAHPHEEDEKIHRTNPPTSCRWLAAGRTGDGMVPSTRGNSSPIDGLASISHQNFFNTTKTTETLSWV